MKIVNSDESIQNGANRQRKNEKAFPKLEMRSRIAQDSAASDRCPEDESSEPVDKTSGGSAAAPSVDEPPAREERASGPPPPADLGSFCLSLATQASGLLDGGGLPEGASVAEGLQGARSIIAILEMLHDKTEGRRTAEEKQVSRLSWGSRRSPSSVAIAAAVIDSNGRRGKFIP